MKTNKGDNNSLNNKGMPNIIDYLAGLMLVNGFYYIWMLFLGFVVNIDWFNDILLADGTLIIYFLGGTIASYLVCKKASLKHLTVGLKFAFIGWIISLMSISSFKIEISLGLAIALLFCNFMGGIFGAYLALWSTLTRAGAQSKIDTFE